MLTVGKGEFPGKEGDRMPRRKIEAPSAGPFPSAEETAGASVSPALSAVCGRIRFFREKRRMGQKELAGKLGISANAVSNWEHGRGRPDLNLLPALCAALEISFYELFGIPDPALPPSPEEQLLLERYRALSRGHRSAVDRMTEALLDAQAAESLPPIRRLVCYGKALSAGPGDPTEFNGEGTPIYLYASRRVDRADCVFSVSGDSMEPRFHDGDRVLVSRIPDASALQYGEVGAFIAGNETYIKVSVEDGLHSLNPAYGVIRFGEDTPVYLIGRVTGTLAPEEIASEEDIARYLALQG